MDVFSISAGQAPKARDSGNADKQSPLSRGDHSAQSVSPVEDSFAASQSARQASGLVHRLVTGAEANGRTDLVDKFRALMVVEELDSFAAAERAAEAIVGGSSV